MAQNKLAINVTAVKPYAFQFDSTNSTVASSCFDAATGNIDISSVSGAVDITWKLATGLPAWTPPVQFGNGSNRIPPAPPGNTPAGYLYGPPILSSDYMSVTVNVPNAGGPQNKVTNKYTLNDYPDQDDPTIINR